MEVPLPKPTEPRGVKSFDSECGSFIDFSFGEALEGGGELCINIGPLSIGKEKGNLTGWGVAIFLVKSVLDTCLVNPGGEGERVAGGEELSTFSL